MTAIEWFLVSVRAPSVLPAVLVVGMAIVAVAVAWAVLGDTLATPHLAPTRWIVTRVG